jgi:hypothetical protein
MGVRCKVCHAPMDALGRIYHSRNCREQWQQQKGQVHKSSSPAPSTPTKQLHTPKQPPQLVCDFCGEQMDPQAYFYHFMSQCKVTAPHVEAIQDLLPILWITPTMDVVVETLSVLPKKLTVKARKKLRARLVDHIHDGYVRYWEANSQNPKTRYAEGSYSSDDAFYRAYQGGAPGNGKRS